MGASMETGWSSEVSAEQAGCTLAHAVRQSCVPTCAWSQARELCKRGKVRVNGELARDAALRLAAGDRVEVDPQAKRQREHVLDDAALIYADTQIAVVDKPRALLSVPFESGDKNTLVDQLRFLLRRKFPGHGGELGVVQRLDRDTTGVMVFARTLAAKRRLQELFRRHDIERRYLALVHGSLAGERTFESLLIPDRGDGLRGSFGLFRRGRGAPPSAAQPALTRVRPLAALEGATLVECQLETGRQHQIRIHLSEAGHPIVGETVYIRDYRLPLLAAERPMLHAAVLGFAHPSNGRPMHFERSAPDDFERCLSGLRR
jgi:23S rRNA pseudouridine1911/1915/1917 synthase